MASASHTPLVSYLPADVPLTSEIPDIVSPYAYALYPFLSPRALPWYMNTAGAFRVRRVGEWLTRSKGEDLEKTGGLVQGQGKLVTVGRYAGTYSFTGTLITSACVVSQWTCAIHSSRLTHLWRVAAE